MSAPEEDLMKALKSVVLAGTIMLGSAYMQYSKGGWRDFVLLGIFTAAVMVYVNVDWNKK